MPTTALLSLSSSTKTALPFSGSSPRQVCCERAIFAPRVVSSTGSEVNPAAGLRCQLQQPGKSPGSTGRITIMMETRPRNARSAQLDAIQPAVHLLSLTFSVDDHVG